MSSGWRGVVLGVALLAISLVSSGADEATANPTPSRTLIAVIAPRTNPEQDPNWQDGSTCRPADADPDFQEGGKIDQGIDERKEQMEDEGYVTEVRYFSSLQAFLCWLYEQDDDTWVHVELYGHGSPAGPHDGENAGFDNALVPSDVDKRWIALGQQLGRVMTSGPGKNGHIVLGYCDGTGDPANPPPLGTQGGRLPGAIVAHHSGKPVYTTGQNRLLYPYYKDADNVPVADENAPGVPYGQPCPEGDVELPPEDPNDPEAEPEVIPGAHPPGRDGPTDPGDSGWDRFRPGHPDGEQAAPTDVPPADRDGFKLPKSPAEGGSDPDSGNTEPDPATPSTPDNDSNSPPPPPPEGLVPSSEVGC